MLETPQITQSMAQQTAVIHLTIPRNQIQQVMGPGIQELMTTLGSQGIAPWGPLFSQHFKMEPETFDFEISVPVASPVKAAGRVMPGQLPAVKVARTVYQGPYEGLGAAWGEFDKWIQSQGLQAAPNLWECYQVGPESGPDSSKYRTELNRPLID